MKNKKFTLIEIMIVVAIIAILSAIAVPELNKNREITIVQTKMANIRMIESAVACYLATNPDKNCDDIDSLIILAGHLSEANDTADEFLVSGETVTITNGKAFYASLL